MSPSVPINDDIREAALRARRLRRPAAPSGGRRPDESDRALVGVLLLSFIIIVVIAGWSASVDTGESADLAPAAPPAAEPAVRPADG